MTQPRLRLKAPATQRNREPIRQVLQQYLPQPARVLEIAAGTGEHAIYLAHQLPNIEHWQPTDIDPAALDSIDAWRHADPHPALQPARYLDTRTTADSPAATYNTLLAINMIHIAPWHATEGLMQLARHTLEDGGILYLYGPFWQQEVAPVESNLAFDASLRERNPAWGIRDLEQVSALAESAGLYCEAIHAMPANNLSVLFRKGLKG